MERRHRDIDELVNQINARFSSKVYQSEPIMRRGRDLPQKNFERTQRKSPPQNGQQNIPRAQDISLSSGQYASQAHLAPAHTANIVGRFSTPTPEPLPKSYQAARSISRYQVVDGKGRWLSEAELFYRQGKALEYLEDSYEYQGRFSAYYPTYNDMSDRQLRGYITWRTHVRAGDIQPGSLSYAYLYFYELICGIGYNTPQSGFNLMHTFWEAYRAFEPNIDRYARKWLHDFVIYHELDPKLLSSFPAIQRDQELLALIKAWLPFDPKLGALADIQIYPNVPVQTLPLPPNAALEDVLLATLNTASSYRLDHSKLFKDHPDDVRHVACAVFARMLAYCRKHRTRGYIEGTFGETAQMGYTMFSSAVFFEEHRHPDTTYQLDPLCTYTCSHGFWECKRIYGGKGTSKTFGTLMKAVDQRLRVALDYQPTLLEKSVPKYLERIITQEIGTWLSWKQAHAPRKIAIDLSKLADIRSAAAQTREALLTDEERDDASSTAEANSTSSHDLEPSIFQQNGIEEPLKMPSALIQSSTLSLYENSHETVPKDISTVLSGAVNHQDGKAPSSNDTPVPTSILDDLALDEHEFAFLHALITEDATDTRNAAVAAGISVDMMADRVNEALFDIVGDTVIEFGDMGPHIIEDYLEDVKGLIK